jgi:excisionase family DNA binding protein
MEYTIKTAAEAVGVTEPTIRKYVRNGRIRAYLRGGRIKGPQGGYILRHDDVEAFRRWWTHETEADMEEVEETCDITTSETD